MKLPRLDTSACPTPYWLPEGHSQTLYALFFARYPRLAFARERVELQDGDFMDFDWNGPGLSLPTPPLAGAANPAVVREMSTADWHRLPQTPHTPALILFHGLEGSSLSRYAQSISHYFHARGWVVVIAHFRGCSGTPNRLVRAYHSGDSNDIAFMLNHVRKRLPHAAWHAVGVSLGGNALLKYLGEQDARHALTACAAISVPIDLVASGYRLSRPFIHRRLYAAYFLRTMKAKIRAKAEQFPGAIDVTRVIRAHDFYAFDEAYTAPIHGFRNVLDYWTRASSKPGLSQITVPTLILNARNDPFLPAAALPSPADCSACVLLHQPSQGGHAGFPTGPFPCHLNWLPARLARFFKHAHFLT